MLEPILEETSEEEENLEIWSHYESVWSSESDTGSVIRVDLTQGDLNHISYYTRRNYNIYMRVCMHI